MNTHRPNIVPGQSPATLRIGAVGLIVRDLGRTVAFYRDVIGLRVVDRSDGTARLGAGGAILLTLDERPNARPDDERRAGLYHTAFLMPERADLARWVRHAAHRRTPIVGMSDHAVSEAIYLDDPEGNGVEVYVDRPREEWEWVGDLVTITTEPLDVESLLAQDETGAYDGAPDGTRIGHVHLRVGDVARAESFYRDAIGLDVTRRRTGATFLSSGRYHHHVAANVWRSAGADRRGGNEAGLAWFSMEAPDPAAVSRMAETIAKAGGEVKSIPGGIVTHDPWGNRVHIIASAA